MKNVGGATRVIFIAALALGFAAPEVLAQSQIPTIQVCNGTTVKGKGVAKVDRRTDPAVGTEPARTGTVDFEVQVSCSAGANNGYPAGSVVMKFDLADSVRARMTSTSIDQAISLGKVTPTTFISGRCNMSTVVGCRFWLLLADNHPDARPGTPDILSVVVLNSEGIRAAYFSGPIIKRGVTIQPH